MITLEMKLAAARAIAALAREDEIVPGPLDQKVHDAVARAGRGVRPERGLAAEMATSGI